METRNPSDIAHTVDVIMTSTGSSHLMRRYWVEPGAVVISVGITRVTGEDGSTHLVSGCAIQELVHARAATPVLGGIGPTTIACLLSNTAKAATLACDG